MSEISESWASLIVPESKLPNSALFLTYLMLVVMYASVFLKMSEITESWASV